MPKVEEYGYLQTSLRPINQQGLTMQTSPDAFGAAVGRGLNAFGQGVSQVGDAMAAIDQIQSNNRLKKAEIGAATADRDTLYGENGFNYKQGAAAVAGKKTTLDQIDKNTSAWSKDLTPAEAEKFKLARQERALTTKTSVMEHSAREGIADTIDTSKAVLDSSASDAVAFYNEPKRAEQSLAKGYKEIDNTAGLAGWNPERVKVMKQGLATQAYTGMIARMAADDPLKAKAFYDTKKDQISGEAQIKIDAFLKEGVINEKSKQEADRILAQERVNAQAVKTNPDGSVSGGGAPGRDLAADLVESKEGFVATPYYDVNHHRIGFGSDTVTREDGSVVSTRPGMSITRADARRDMQRRLDESEKTYVNAVGADNWNRLSPNARAAAQSVAWNYGIGGSAPRDIMRAIARGEGDEGVARAIEAHARDNGGRLRDRRAHEAAIARGQAKVGSSQAGYGSRVTTAEDQLLERNRNLDGIADPEVRELTRKRLDALDAAQAQAAAADAKAAGQQLWAIVDAGGTPDDASPELRLQAGAGATESAWSAVKARNERGAPVDDQELLYKFRREAAEDPDNFAKKNLLESKGSLSKEAFKELSDKQATILSGDRKAKEEGVNLSTAFDMSKSTLRAAGITGRAASNDPDGQQAEAKREAQFQNALAESMAEFKQTQGKNPDAMEIQQLIARQLMPIIMKNQANDGWFTSGDKPGFAFEMRTAEPGTTATPAVKITDIDVTTRAMLTEAYTSKFGHPPSQDELISFYVKFLTETSAGKPGGPQ